MNVRAAAVVLVALLAGCLEGDDAPATGGSLPIPTLEDAPRPTASGYLAPPPEPCASALQDGGRAPRWQANVSRGYAVALALSSDLAVVGLSSTLAALRLADGALAWTAPLEAEPMALAVSEAGGFVLASGRFGTRAFDLGDGDVRWSAPGGGAVKLPDGRVEDRPAEAHRRVAVSPDGRFVLVAGPRVVALDASTGHELWSAPWASRNASYEEATHAGAIGFSRDGGTAWAHLDSHAYEPYRAVAWDAATGEETWRAEGRTPGTGMRAERVAEAQGLVAFAGTLTPPGTTDHRVGFVQAFDAATGDLAWETTLPEEVQDFPAAIVFLGAEGAFHLVLADEARDHNQTATVTRLDAATGAAARTFSTWQPFLADLAPLAPLAPDASALAGAGSVTRRFEDAQGHIQADAAQVVFRAGPDPWCFAAPGRQPGPLDVAARPDIVVAVMHDGDNAVVRAFDP